MNFTVTPPRELHGRLGGIVIRRRSADSQEDFHEKLIVANAPLENADTELLSLFWLTFLEWNMAPPRRANTIIMTDANGRTGLDHAQAANNDRNADWKVVGDCCLKITTASGKERVNICDQAGLCLDSTRRNGRRHPESAILLSGRNALTKRKSKLATKLVRVCNSGRSVIMFRIMSDSRIKKR